MNGARKKIKQRGERKWENAFSFFLSPRFFSFFSFDLVTLRWRVGSQVIKLVKLVTAKIKAKSSQSKKLLKAIYNGCLEYPAKHTIQHDKELVLPANRIVI